MQRFYVNTQDFSSNIDAERIGGDSTNIVVIEIQKRIYNELMNIPYSKYIERIRLILEWK